MPLKQRNDSQQFIDEEEIRPAPAWNAVSELDPKWSREPLPDQGSSSPNAEEGHYPVLARELDQVAPVDPAPHQILDPLRLSDVDPHLSRSRRATPASGRIADVRKSADCRAIVPLIAPAKRTPADGWLAKAVRSCPRALPIDARDLRLCPSSGQREQPI